MAATDPEFTLYTYFRSSCSARLRIALNIKKIPYDSHYINLLKDEQSSSEYDAVSPSHLVPSLRLLKGEDTGAVLTQSLAMMEYLDEAYPDTASLLPPKTDMVGRAHVRALAAVIACDVQPVTNLRMLKIVDSFGGSREAFAKRLIEEGLAAYERLAVKDAGRFSYGGQMTMADICLVPAVWGAMRFGVDIGQYPIVK